MPITKVSTNVIASNIATTDTIQTFTKEKVIELKYATTSSTSLTIGTGTKSLTVGTGLAYLAGDPVRILRTGFTSNMAGTVTSYDKSTGAMVANITTTSGTGTYTAWTVTNFGTTVPAIRITQDGEGQALLVEDIANPDASPFYISASGHMRAPNGISLGSSSVATTGVSTNYIAAANPNSTSGLYLCSFNGLWAFRATANFSTQGQTQTFDLSELAANPFKILVQSFVTETTISTGVVNYQAGGYQGDVVLNSSTTDNAIYGYTVNNATTAVNITTIMGVAQTKGGIPASGYVSLQGTAASGGASGTLIMTVRGHTTADTASIAYSSSVAVILMSPQFL